MAQKDRFWAQARATYRADFGTPMCYHLISGLFLKQKFCSSRPVVVRRRGDLSRSDSFVCWNVSQRQRSAAAAVAD
jgi:hypothetical protein